MRSTMRQGDRRMRIGLAAVSLTRRRGRIGVFSRTEPFAEVEAALSGREILLHAENGEAEALVERARLRVERIDLHADAATRPCRGLGHADQCGTDSGATQWRGDEQHLDDQPGIDRPPDEPAGDRAGFIVQQHGEGVQSCMPGHGRVEIVQRVEDRAEIRDGRGVGECQRAGFHSGESVGRVARPVRAGCVGDAAGAGARREGAMHG
jgi:hypothetical protein